MKSLTQTDSARPPPIAGNRPLVTPPPSSWPPSRPPEARRLDAARAPCSPMELHLPHGGLSMTVPVARVVTSRIWGHLDGVIADRLLTLVDQRLAITERQLVGFHDWSEMESYETSARLRLTSWVIENRQRCEAIHILSRSRLVAMGVAVANMALGRFLVSYRPCERQRFDAALQAAISLRAPQATA